MATPRFFVDFDLAVGRELALPDDVAHHATRALRLTSGAPIVLFNGRGGEFHAVLRADDRHAFATVQSFDPVERESSLDLTLIQAWISTDKLDWVVEKAVELGVSRIVLTPSARSVVRVEGERRTRRLSHLRLLIQSACAQCGRNRVPPLEAGDTLPAALSLAGSAPLLALLPTAPHALVQEAATLRAARLLVGPEGGLSDDEIAMAFAAGAAAARLGSRVLRTETAGLAALAAFQAVGGDYRD
jgi:16S rRNA (uracil1498-N3)-methyltransferase